MPQHEAGNDDGRHDLAALVFSVADDSAEESVVKTLHGYAPAEPEDTPTVLDAVRAQIQTEDGDEKEEDAGPLFTVINPPETVSVTALIDGSPHEVDMLAEVANMTESELAQEILVLADLARQKGLAGQYAYLSKNMGLLGADDGPLRGYLEGFMGLSSPEKAAAAQAEVFATRYRSDK